MRFALSFALAASFFGCTAAIGDGTSATSDSDSGTSSGDDTATGEEDTSGDPSDTGTGTGDTSTGITDTGTKADTGTAKTDTGTTKTDTGTPKTDTGTGTTDTGAPPSDTGAGDPLAAARATCVDEINKYRATLSLPPYAGWTSAQTCADGQCKSDSESGKAHGAFGKCGESAQNECPGWPGPPDTLIKGCLKMMWDEGPGADFSKHGHYINMSSASYTTVACGFYQTPSGSWWAVQDFR